MIAFHWRPNVHGLLRIWRWPSAQRIARLQQLCSMFVVYCCWLGRLSEAGGLANWTWTTRGCSSSFVVRLAAKWEATLELAWCHKKMLAVKGLSSNPPSNGPLWPIWEARSLTWIWYGYPLGHVWGCHSYCALLLIHIACGYVHLCSDGRCIPSLCGSHELSCAWRKSSWAYDTKNKIIIFSTFHFNWKCCDSRCRPSLSTYRMALRSPFSIVGPGCCSPTAIGLPP